MTNWTTLGIINKELNNFKLTMSSLNSIIKRLHELTLKKGELLSLFRAKVQEAELKAVKEEIAKMSVSKDDKI